jgi:hypothetical protein
MGLTAKTSLRRIGQMPTPQRDLEQEIERLVRELGQVVRSADPEKQDQLKEFASTLVDQEFVPMGQSARAAAREARRPMSPLAAGLGLLVLGAGLFFFVPPVGVVLGIVGFIGIAWGIVADFTKK